MTTGLEKFNRIAKAVFILAVLGISLVLALLLLPDNRAAIAISVAAMSLMYAATDYFDERTLRRFYVYYALAWIIGAVLIAFVPDNATTEKWFGWAVLLLGFIIPSGIGIVSDWVVHRSNAK